MDIVLSHWSHYVEDFSFSSQEFYELLEDALNRRGIPSVKIKRKKHHENVYMISAERLYLRVERKRLMFDICAAPFGANGYFFSWWMGESVSLLRHLVYKIPFIGRGLEAFFWPLTFYKMDTRKMFQSAVGTCLHEVMDQVMSMNGLRQLNEAEKKPILQDIFKR